MEAEKTRRGICGLPAAIEKQDTSHKLSTKQLDFVGRCHYCQHHNMHIDNVQVFRKLDTYCSINKGKGKGKGKGKQPTGLKNGQ